MKSPFYYDAEKHRKQSRLPERKRYKRSQSQSVKSPFNYNAVKCCKLKKSWSQSLKKSPNNYSRPKVSPQVPVNSSQENSSLKRGLS